MPILICYVFYNINLANKKPKIYLLLALFFSMLGDVFLMFSGVNEMFFLIGLSMFLITHGFYITLFLTNKRSELKLGKVVFSVLIIVSYYLIMESIAIYLPIIIAVVGLLYMFAKKAWVMKQDAGDGKMKEISDHIYEGALAFLKAEYRLLTFS
jgi:uncharacterized membrane protein YhhN